MERIVTVELSYDEALVLSGWLARLASRTSPSSLEVGAAELIALNQLDTALEPVIDEVFDPGWDEIVEPARDRLLGRSTS